MGAVHGVHLKYAAMSALCATGAMHHSRQRDEQEELISPILVGILVYSALIHALITALFVSRRGEWVIGKNAQTGTVPLWSFLVFFPFHLPTWLYTSVHTEISKRKGVPVASEVAPGWWIGGCYAAQLERRWAATVVRRARKHAFTSSLRRDQHVCACTCAARSTPHTPTPPRI